MLPSCDLKLVNSIFILMEILVIQVNDFVSSHRDSCHTVRVIISFQFLPFPADCHSYTRLLIGQTIDLRLVFIDEI